MEEENELRQSDTGNGASFNANDKIDRRIQNYQKQLRRLATELSLAEARERREIASDLHDHIGQALAYVSQKVAILQGNAIFSGMEKDFSEILSILNQTIQYTRNLTVQISPPVLYELGLPAAIDWLAERATQRYKLKAKAMQSGNPQDISEDIRVFIFKAVQELINNVAKHAGANRIDISANWMENGFKLIISDDGQGFDTTSFDRVLAGNCCFGLFSIRERLSYIGGTLSIKSSSGKGTRISMTAPYKIADEAEND
ncbi:MAG: sensor histidine kinase [Candidatus Zixiibacteriota bacterium]